MERLLVNQIFDKCHIKLRFWVEIKLTLLNNEAKISKFRIKNSISYSTDLYASVHKPLYVLQRKKKNKKSIDQAEEASSITKDEPNPNVILTEMKPRRVKRLATDSSPGTSWRTVERRICRTPITKHTKVVKWKASERISAWNSWAVAAALMSRGLRVPETVTRMGSKPALKTAFGSTSWGVMGSRWASSWLLVSSDAVAIFLKSVSEWLLIRMETMQST